MNARCVFKIAAVVGVPLTGYLSARGAMTKAEYIKRNGSPQTKKEKIKDNARAYWPAAVSGAATIASILISDSLATKAIAAATSSAAVAIYKKDAIKHQFDKYRGVVKEDAGEEKDREYLKKASEVKFDDEGEVLREFKISWLDDKPLYFTSTMSKVNEALNEINRMLLDYNTGSGIVTGTDVLRLLGHEELATPKTDLMGWGSDLLAIECECYWLEFYKYKESEAFNYHGDGDRDAIVIDVVWPPYDDIRDAYALAEKEGTI